MRQAEVITLAAAVLMLCGCSNLGPNHPAPLLPRARETEPTPVVTKAPDGKPSLMEAEAAFARAAEDLGAADSFHEYMTGDSLLLLPGEMPIKGNDAIKVHLLVNPPGVFLFRVRDAQASESSDLGFTWGTYECQPKAPEDQRPRNRFGKYLTIWSKQADGSWKIQVHSQSPNPSPAERR
jgi:ketosteroid isomerase-like protein